MDPVGTRLEAPTTHLQDAQRVHTQPPPDQQAVSGPGV